jgi:hypothetical protein
MKQLLLILVLLLRPVGAIAAEATDGVLPLTVQAALGVRQVPDDSLSVFV